MGVLYTWVKLLTDFGLWIAQKMPLEAGLARIRQESYSAPPRPPSRYKGGGEGGEGKGRFGYREWEKGGGKDMNCEGEWRDAAAFLDRHCVVIC